MGVLAANGISHILKVAIARPRPHDDVIQALQDVRGFAFPSGHVIHQVVFLGTLAVVLTWEMRPCITRWLIHAGLALALIAIGVSRVYLGAHFVGDVVGAYVFGGGIVAVLVLLWRLWLDRSLTA